MEDKSINEGFTLVKKGIELLQPRLDSLKSANVLLESRNHELVSKNKEALDSLNAIKAETESIAERNAENLKSTKDKCKEMLDAANRKAIEKHAEFLRWDEKVNELKALHYELDKRRIAEVAGAK